MEDIQVRITSGEKIVIKKPIMKISVRFNNTDSYGLTRWIILIDSGEPIYVSNIKLKIHLSTESGYIEGVGLKHHLSGYAKKIKFRKNIAYIS
jgi:hypothetical protein